MELGSLLTQQFIIKESDGSVKLSIDDMSMQELTILVGQNGTGKTLALINAFTLGLAMANHINWSVVRGTPMSETEEKENIQFILDNSYENNDFTGTMAGEFERGNINLYVEEGKLKKYSIEISDDVDSCAPPIFLSKRMRTWDSFHLYCQLRSALLPFESMLDSKLLFGMLKSFKLYDVMYSEKIINLLKDKGYQVSDEFSRAYCKFTEDKECPFTRLFLDVDKLKVMCEDRRGKTFPITVFGAGHQSIITMVLSLSN